MTLYFYSLFLDGVYQECPFRRYYSVVSSKQLFSSHISNSNISPQETSAVSNSTDHQKAIRAVLLVDPPKELYPNRLLITASDDCTAKVWNLDKQELIMTTPKAIKDKQNNGHNDKITALAYYSNLKENRVEIITGGDARCCNIFVWDIQGNAVGNMNCIPVDSDKAPLVVPKSSSNEEKTNSTSTKLNKKLVRVHDGAISCIQLQETTDKGTVMIVSSYDRTVSVWNYHEKVVLWTFGKREGSEITYHTDLILSVQCYFKSYPPEGNNNTNNSEVTNNMKMVTASWDKRIRIWQYNSNKPFKKLLYHKKSVTCTAICTLKVLSRVNSGQKVQLSSTILVSGSLDKTVIVWDLENLEINYPIRILKGHGDKITSVHVHDTEMNGLPPLVITSSDDKTIILWNLLSGDVIRKFHFVGAVNCAALLNTKWGMVVAGAGGSDTEGTVAVWNLTKTDRIRRIKAEAITGIAVYYPRNGEFDSEPKLVAATINSSASIYNYRTGEKIGLLDKASEISAIESDKNGSLTAGHQRRLNGVAIYSPPSIFEAPQIITFASDNTIKLWNMNTCRVIYTFVEHKGPVMALAVYDPSLSVDVMMNKCSGDMVDVSKPLIVSGGLDKAIMIWDFTTGDRKGFKAINYAHDAMIRSIVVHYPRGSGNPFFITASYDKTTKIWNLRNLQLLQILSEHHTQFIFAVAAYDPVVHFGSFQNCPEDNKDFLVVTGSYDKTVAVWNFQAKDILKDAPVEWSFDAQLKNQKPKTIMQFHTDSVVTLALYIPPPGKDAHPLVITGSIDKLVIVADLITGTRLQILVGHMDRVCYLTVFTPSKPADFPTIISGGDDKMIIVWEDSLYQNNLPLMRDNVNRAFASDLSDADWPLLTEWTMTHPNHRLFIENSHLFQLAIKYKRPDFLLKFRAQLTKVLLFMKPYNEFNILTYAVQQNDLPSVRAILLSWIEILNNDCRDILTQRLYHASYFFPDEDLDHLASKYPSEFMVFIKALKLVRNNSALILNKGQARVRRLDDRFRCEIRGIYERVMEFERLWGDSSQDVEKFAFWNLFSDKNLHVVALQPISSLMIPLKNTSDLQRFLFLCYRVSDLLDDVDIFNSEIVQISLQFCWETSGLWKHLFSMLVYSAFLALFILCIYSFQFSSNVGRGQGVQTAVTSLNALVIVCLVVYVYKEILQFYATYLRASQEQSDNSLKYVENNENELVSENNSGAEKETNKSSYLLFIALKVHFTDIWNM